MATWKQQCFFCSDTVSTGSLNRNYYKMHLENVHNIQMHSEQLLSWTLAQQNLNNSGKSGGGSTLSSVASILGMKGITITKDSSSPGNGVPNSLINIKGITVQKVSDDIQVVGSPVTGAAPRGRGGITPRGGLNRPPGQHSNIARQQEQAIERWSNACEHGCRVCRSEGKNFTTFNRNTLVKHLESVHKISERDYKEEFKCQNLITRASNMTCAECKHKVKRIPSSLSAHVKKHGMSIRQYWMKHVAPKGSALANFSPNPAFRGQATLRGRAVGVFRGGPMPRGRGGFVPQFRGGMRPQMRPGAPQGGDGLVNGTYQPKVMLNRMDDDAIAREEAGLGGDDAMEVELDPLTLLEMGMGEDVIQLEGVAVKEEVDSAGEGDDTPSLQITPDQEEDEGEGEDEERKEGGSRDLTTPDMDEERGVEGGEEGESRSAEEEGEEAQENTEEAENDGIEVVRDVSMQKADPKTAIPMPDLSTPEKAKASGGESPAEPREEEDKTTVSKHSIGNILSSSEHKDDSAAKPAESAAEEQVKQYLEAPAEPVQQQTYSPPTNNLPYTGSDQAGFQQPSFQPYPPPPPTSFQPFQPPSLPFNNFSQPFANNFPPPSNQGYLPPNGSSPYPPSYPPSTQQGGYQSPYPSPHFSAPKTRWESLSCPYSIAQCPLYCCHVRGMQELEEGSTDWSRPYGPPASGFGNPCSCCINT